MTAHHGTGTVEHAPGCPGPRLVRHDGARVAQITCTACGRWVTVPRRNEWRDRHPPEETTMTDPTRTRRREVPS